eukprot:2254377-Prymnesium_polylepis.1
MEGREGHEGHGGDAAGRPKVSSKAPLALRANNMEPTCLCKARARAEGADPAHASTICMTVGTRLCLRGMNSHNYCTGWTLRIRLLLLLGRWCFMPRSTGWHVTCSSACSDTSRSDMTDVDGQLPTA